MSELNIYSVPCIDLEDILNYWNTSIDDWSFLDPKNFPNTYTFFPTDKDYVEKLLRQIEIAVDCEHPNPLYVRQLDFERSLIFYCQQRGFYNGVLIKN